MDAGIYALLLLPAALGLLGFIEPCTLGAHLLFLRSIASGTRAECIRAALVFLVVRAVVIGSIGALVALVGQRLLPAQGVVWLVFGVVYIAIGTAYLAGRGNMLKWNINLAPESWNRATTPVSLGIVFGFNIPACAAPILFGLVGMVANAGSIAMGFMAMAVFGAALSAPLVLIAGVPRLSAWFGRRPGQGRKTRWVLGLAFVVVGLWSIWFGLFVDPADWANL